MRLDSWESGRTSSKKTTSSVSTSNPDLLIKSQEQRQKQDFTFMKMTYRTMAKNIGGRANVRNNFTNRGSSSTYVWYKYKPSTTSPAKVMAKLQRVQRVEQTRSFLSPIFSVPKVKILNIGISTYEGHFHKIFTVWMNPHWQMRTEVA